MQLSTLSQMNRGKTLPHWCGLKLDLKAVEEEIDRQDTLSGGNSPDAAMARFSLTLTKKSPGEVAEYIGKHRE
jgi:hypothetical protein